MPPDAAPLSPELAAADRSPRIGAATLRLGYVALTDAAPLIVAREKGFFRQHGLPVELVPLEAWSALRDRLAVGQLDGAQMLSPMPIAASFGLGGVQAPLVVAATLGLNGNTVTLGAALLAEIAAAAPELAASRPLPASALAAALAHRRAGDRPPPVLAVVFPFSSHNYLLRYWLATAGIDPDRDVRLAVVPPSRVADQLAAGAIDGFCAGEPWGSLAVAFGGAAVALRTADIWRNHPEKVLAFSAAHAARAPDRVAAAVAAIIQAGRWLEQPAHHEEAARLLCAHALRDVPETVVAPALSDHLVFRAGAATFPFVSHGAWWFGQMRRWRHLPDDASPAIVRRIWRPDLWRRGAALVREPAPLIDVKPEGGHAAPWPLAATPAPIAMLPDAFADGSVFPAAAPVPA